jgi:hypothetical protein
MRVSVISVEGVPGYDAQKPTPASRAPLARASLPLIRNSFLLFFMPSEHPSNPSQNTFESVKCDNRHNKRKKGVTNR